MKKLILFLLIGVFMISLTSSAEFDNVINYDETTDTITFKNMFGLGRDQVKATLQENLCEDGRLCHADKEIILYEEGALIQDFKTLRVDDDSWEEQDIRWHKFEYWGDIDEYGSECNTIEVLQNGTQVEECNWIITGSHKGWVEFKEGDIFSEGKYNVRTSGEIRSGRVYDWQVKINGDWTTPWAIWGNISLGDDAEVILNSPIDNFESPNTEVEFNCTANVTGGANLLNISLYTNESGTWSAKNITIINNTGLNETHGFSMSADGSQTIKLGGKITMKETRILTNVTKFFASNPTQAILMNSTESILAVANFTGEVASFNFELQEGVKYIIATDNFTNIYSSSHRGEFTSGAIEKTFFNYTFGYLEGNPNNGDFNWIYNILSISTLAPASITQTWNRTINDSTLWSCQGCDSDGVCGFANENRTVNLESISPQINIIAPVGVLDTNSIGGSENLNWTVNDTNLDTCWYDYNGTNVTVNCLDNNTTFILEEDNFNLTFYANDTIGNEASNFTSWSYEFLEGSSTFNSTTFETSTETFITNITTLSNILTINPILNYNGTRTLGTADCEGSSCTLSATIDINLIESGESENKTWFWEVNGFTTNSSFEFNSTSQIQNVTRIHLEECGGSFTTAALNFTAFDESDLSAVDPFEFEGTFDTWIGSGNVKRQTNFSDSSTSSFSLCITPTNRNFKTDAVIEYDEASGVNYTRRNYYFDNDIINSTVQNIGLGLLLSELSTSFILRVQDTDILPVPNASIFTERFYPGTNSFEVVQVARTDDNGQSIGFFKTETVDYRFIIKLNGTTVLATGIQKIVGTSVPFTLTFTIGEDEGSSWEGFEELDGLAFVNNFNKTSNIYTFTYTDTSGDFESSALEIYKVNASGNDPLLCNNTITQSSASLLCDLTGNSTGQYIAKGIIFRDGVRNLVFQEQFNIEDFSGTAGELGLFLGFFIILIASFAFRFNEIAGIFMINIAMIFVNAIGLIAFGPVFIGSMIAISIIIGVILER